MITVSVISSKDLNHEEVRYKRAKVHPNEDISTTHPRKSDSSSSDFLIHSVYICPRHPFIWTGFQTATSDSGIFVWQWAFGNWYN